MSNESQPLVPKVRINEAVHELIYKSNMIFSKREELIKLIEQYGEDQFNKGYADGYEIGARDE